MLTSDVHLQVSLNQVMTIFNQLPEDYKAAIVEEYEKTVLDEAQFWELIRLFQSKSFDSEVLTEALSVMPLKAITQFEEILAHQLYLIDGKKYATVFYKEAVSADGFLYWRCGIIAQGKDFFENFLANPFYSENLFPCEPLLYVAEKAYKLKTGLPTFDYIPTHSYETHSNTENWN